MVFQRNLSIAFCLKIRRNSSSAGHDEKTGAVVGPPSFFGLYCFAQRFVERVREKLGEIDPGLFSAPGKTGRDS